MWNTSVNVVSSEVDLRSRLDLPCAALFGGELEHAVCFRELHPSLINTGVGRVLSLSLSLSLFFVVSTTIQFYDCD